MQITHCLQFRVVFHACNHSLHLISKGFAGYLNEVADPDVQGHNKEGKFCVPTVGQKPYKLP